MPLPLLALLAFAPTTLTLTPTDDVWVYPHASDPGKDAYLRIWGTDGKAAPKDAAEAEEFSLSYLKWKLDGIPAGKPLTSAKLIVTNIADPGYTLEQVKAAPLEARAIGVDFTEKTWAYDLTDKLLPKPAKEAIYGSGYPSSFTSGAPVEISIDLLKGPADIRPAITAASSSPTKELALALTSALDMSALGRTAVFKIFSKDAENATVRPRLVLEFGE